MFSSNATWDRSTTHPKFDPTGVRTHDLQIMTVHFIFWRAIIFGEFGSLRIFAKILSPKLRDRTLIVHCIDGETPNLIAAKSLCFEKRQNLLIYSMRHFQLCFGYYRSNGKQI